jgi:hypothetical protein
MARVRTVDALDAAIAAADRPQAVPALPLQVGGVDPLGLRQLNFDMMDRCIPGLNNAAWRLRPYVIMAWAWYQAARLAERDGLAALPVALGRRFADRVEVMFQAGQLVAREFGGLPGADGLQARVVAPGGYDFSGADWPVWHMKRREGGSLMAPVSYGPSVKEGLGLGFLRSSAGLFAPVDEVMPAVLALDARLAPALADAAFASLECGPVLLERMTEWHSLWRMDDLSPPEIDVGRAALLGAGRTSPRARTLALVGSILASAAASLDVGEIRLLAARSDMPWSDRPTARLWRALQARQLLRLSLEGLLHWVLAQASGGPATLDELVSRLLAALDPGPATPFGEWLARPCPAADGLDGIVSPVSLLKDLGAAHQPDAPALCATGLRAAVAICRGMGSSNELFGGQPDRLPLARLSQRFASAAALPMRDACELIVSELLIGQHVYWAVGRSGDDTQRLRIVLDEGGWIALQGPGHAVPTPDRLYTLLELAADCRIVSRAEGGYMPGPAPAAVADADW